MSWSSFYADRVGDSYPTYCKKRYKEFIDTLNSMDAKTIAEEGCGIGTITKVIHTHNARYTLFDYDKGQVALTKQNLINKTNIVINTGNILHYTHKERQDLIFSHGVLEHFTPAQMKDIIKRQRRQATNVVYYIPTDRYKSKSFGDELLMSREWWVKKYNPTSWVTFNEGKDLVLTWKHTS